MHQLSCLLNFTPFGSEYFVFQQTSWCRVHCRRTTQRKQVYANAAVQASLSHSCLTCEGRFETSQVQRQCSYSSQPPSPRGRARPPARPPPKAAGFFTVRCSFNEQHDLPSVGKKPEQLTHTGCCSLCGPATGRQLRREKDVSTSLSTSSSDQTPWCTASWGRCRLKNKQFVWTFDSILWHPGQNLDSTDDWQLSNSVEQQLTWVSDNKTLRKETKIYRCSLSTMNSRAQQISLTNWGPKSSRYRTAAANLLTTCIVPANKLWLPTNQEQLLHPNKSVEFIL